MIEFNKLEEMAGDLSCLQNELENPVKNTKGHNYKYSQLDQVLELIKPILFKYGFSIIQSAFNDEIGLGVETCIIHKSGGFIRGSFSSKLEGGMLKGSQAVGSQITYYRRYSILSMLNLASEDDDGASSSNRKAVKQAPKPIVMATQGQKALILELLGLEKYNEHKDFIDSKMTEQQAKEKITLLTTGE